MERDQHTAGSGRRSGGRRQTRRRYLAGAAIAGTGALAAACGGAAGSATSQPKLVKGPVQITWTFWATPENIAFFNETVSAFQTAFPEVKVQGTQIPGVYEDAIFTLVSGGTPPDAMETTRPTATGWAVKGISTALDPYLSRGGFKEGDYYPTAVSPWKVNGKLYALPREVDNWTLWYNKKLFAEAGIKPPDESWTWDTLVANGQRLTKREGGLTQAAFAPGGFNNKLFVALGLQNGTKLQDRETLPTKLLMDQPAFADAMQWMADLMNKQHIAPTQDEIKQGGNSQMLFSSGKLAMWFGEASAAARYAPAIKDFDYDVAAPLKGKQMGTWLGGACHTISRDGKQKEAAAQYLLFMAGPEGIKLLAKYAFGVPAVKSVANSDLFLKQPGPPANKAAWLKAFDYGSGPPMTPVWTDVEAALNAELAQTWTGARSAKDSIAAAWPKVQTLMTQAQEMVKQMPQ